ncbi:MAG: exosortase A [Burkholderiaceae bacterium]|jgi:exosortase A|nr:exosortase A [Burkholderiaceae bacterium]
MPLQPVDAGIPTRRRPFSLEGTTGAVLASFLFACLLSITVFPDVWASMVRVWTNSETFAHGFIALPCAAWMLWRRRGDWQAIPQYTWWPATIALAACGLLWLVGRLGGVSSLEQFGVVGIIPATMLLLVGPALSRAIAFPLAFLFFAVPVGEFLTPIMMDYTADATVAAVRWSGVPVFREGLHFSLPSGRWSVVEACSGLRYLIASLALGVLYAYLQFRTLRYRLAFVALAVVVPIVANWVRAYGIVMLGHISNMKLAAGVDHLVYGWLFFGLVMALLFWVGSLWHEPASASMEVPATRDPAATAEFTLSNKRRIALVLAAIAIVAVWRPVSTTLLDQSRSFDGVAPLRAAVSGLPAAQTLDYQPHYDGASGTLRVAHAIDGIPVELHAFHYARQHETSEMVHGSNYVVRADDFQSQILSTSTRGTPWGSVASYRIRRSETGPLLVWQWYAVAGTQTANPYLAKAATAWSLLTGRGDESLAIVLVTPIETGGGATSREHLRAAAHRLGVFADALQPAIRVVVQAPVRQ